MIVSNVSARPRKGLLDGGATHSWRTARECEWETSKPTTVELAVGTQELRVSPLGTILTRAEVTPICPLGLLVDRLGCRVDWVAGRCRCRVTHPLRGLLNTNLEGNCPVVSEALCLELIEELASVWNNGSGTARSCLELLCRTATRMQAMKRSSDEEIQALRDSGAQIEILPAKALFHLNRRVEQDGTSAV